MRAVSRGSSEKDSKVRPASGVRTMHTVGPSSTCTFFERASAASTSPSCADEVGVPRRPDGRAAGDRQGAPADQAVAADARGAVGHLERGDAQALDGREVPHVGAGGQRGLLVEGHGADEAIDLVLRSSMCVACPVGPPVVHHVSTKGRRRPCSVAPCPGSAGAAASRACTKRRRVSSRVDHVVDLEVLRHVHGLPVLVGPRHHGVEGGRPLVGVIDEVELPPEAQPHRALEAHAAELARRPGHGEQRPAEAAAGHGLRAQPVGLPQ